MNEARRPPRRVHRFAIATVCALLIVLTGWLPVDSAAAQPLAGSVRVSVLQVSPSTPTASPKPRRLDVVLQLTNTTDEPLGKVTVEGARGNPISNQGALDEAIADPAPPAPELAATFSTKKPVTATLPAGGGQTVRYSSTTETAVDAGLCICERRIYPLYFTVTKQDANGADVILGSTQTFIPSFPDTSAKPVQVSWVWPILEPPHRTVRDTVFTDDDLAGSVTDGRLDRLLTVLEDVGSRVPMTVLIDPDLIDELAVMATGSYTVMSGSQSSPGTGAAAAQSWLQRLRTALDDDPGLELAFTPYADPDVDSLTRNGLDWARTLSSSAQTRVSEALGGRIVASDIAWPVGGTLHRATLAALVRSGNKAVIVDDATLPGSRRHSPRPDALAAVRTSAGTATVAVTSAPIERYASDVVSKGGPGLASLPELVSELAVRSVEDGSRSHYVVITPPRNVDPEPSVAEDAILDTARTSWSEPLGLREAVQTVKPAAQGQLRASARAPGLPAETIASAQFMAENLPSVRSLLAGPATPAQGSTAFDRLLGSLTDGVQRSESSQWIPDPSTSASRAQLLHKQVTDVLGGVHLIQPNTGTYTLGSADSPLPITIDNTLDAQVSVRVQVSTVGGLPGFSADDVGVKTVAPKSKLPLHIPVHVDRAGRIKVQVALTTPDGAALGSSLPLSVRSTALGDIGKIITFVAGAVLVAALLFRVLRRWRKRRNGVARGAA